MKRSFDVHVDGHDLRITRDGDDFTVDWLTVPDETYPGGFSSWARYIGTPPTQPQLSDETIIERAKEWMRRELEEHD